MIVGVPKEIKNNENRVGLTPAGVKTMLKNYNKVIVENNAGVGSGFSNTEYINAGAEIEENKEELFNKSDIIVKVKEPLEDEYDLFKPGQILFTYLHLAPNESLTKALLKNKVTSIAYETVQKENGSLPLLTPMSEVAGRMSVQVGANLLQKYNGGLGVLLGGVTGVEASEVVIIGGGVVGTNAAKMAVGLGAKITILNINLNKLAYLDDIFNGRVATLFCNEYNVENYAKKADLLIGAVLIPGASAPRIVTKNMVKQMKKGSVIVDVAIDQGGSIETIDKITTHDNPYYKKYEVLHYSVANMPGAVPRTSTLALEAATLKYLEKITSKGMNAIIDDKELLFGLNTYNGMVTCKPVATSLNLEYVNPLGLVVH